MLVVAREHPLAKRAEIAFAETCSTTISSGSTAPSALQRFLADKAARIGRPLRLRMQLRSFDAVCRMVECNVGIGIVPETTRAACGEDDGDRAVELTDAWALRELTICVRDIRTAALRAAGGHCAQPDSDGAHAAARVGGKERSP